MTVNQVIQKNRELRNDLFGRYRPRNEVSLTMDVRVELLVIQNALELKLIEQNLQ